LCREGVRAAQVLSEVWTLRCRREKSLRTFDGFMVVFTEGLFEMRRVEQGSSKYRAKEQQLGRYCYEAEEHLPAGELRVLKATVGIPERTWQQYKAAFIARSAQ
jgi:hypothetical protein